MRYFNLNVMMILFFLFFSGRLFAADNSVDIHGFISQGYMRTDQNNYIADSEDGTFQYNEMGINFGHEPVDRLMIGIQFFARDLGDVGNDEIQVDYAFADYRLSDKLGVRAGRMKNPMGIYSETRDVDMLRTCVLLPFSVYDENLRDSQTYIQGVSIYGNIITDHFGTMSYQALLGTNNIAEKSATAMFLGDIWLHAESLEMDTTYSYSLQYLAPRGRFKLRATALFSDIYLEGTTLNFPVFTNFGIATGTPARIDVSNIEVYTASFECTWFKWLFSYELKYSKVRDLTFHLPTPVNDWVLPVTHFGYYYMLSYSISEWVDACIYYDVFYPYEKDRNGHKPRVGNEDYDHWMKKWAFSIKIDINTNWVVKLETQYVDGAGSLLDYYNEERRHRYWWLSAVKVSYHF